MDLAQRFRDLRLRAGLTQTALAKPRYTVSYISQIEAGRRTPSPEAMAYFAGRLGVSESYLTTGVPDELEDRLRFRLEEAAQELREGRVQRAETMAREVLEEADRHAMPRLRSGALVVLGQSLAVSGRVRDAIDRLEEALEGDLSQRDTATAVSRLARCYRDLGDLAFAREVIEGFLADVQRPPLEPGIAAELQAVLISIFYERGDMTLAERAADRALAAADMGVDAEVRANAAWDAARVMAEARRWDDALELATRARVLMEELDQRRNVGRLHINSAFICLEAEPPRLDQARRHLDLAERRLVDVGSPEDLAFVWSEWGRLALFEGDLEQAVIQSDRALAHLAGVEGFDAEVAKDLFLKGRALAGLGRREEAREVLELAADLFQTSGARQQQAACYRELGELDLAEGEVDSAIDALRSGLAALDARTSVRAPRLP